MREIERKVGTFPSLKVENIDPSLAYKIRSFPAETGIM
jgi:hypothetical protein